MGKIPVELRNTIAENIRTCRRAFFPGRGGGKKCAEAFGVSPQQWSLWERAMRTPDELRLRQIADFFGVQQEWLRRNNSGKYPSGKDLAPQDPASHSEQLAEKHRKWTQIRNADPVQMAASRPAEQEPPESADRVTACHPNIPPMDCIATAMYSRANVELQGFLPPQFNAAIHLTDSAAAAVGTLFHETRMLARSLAGFDCFVRIEVYCNLANPIVVKAY